MNHVPADPMLTGATSAVLKKSRVLLVEDHPLVRIGLAATINGDPCLELCGEADNAADAWRLIEDRDPDVVVVDLVLKSGAGIELIRRIAKQMPPVRVVVSSMLDRGVYESRVLDAGAAAFVPKDASVQLLLAELRSTDTPAGDQPFEQKGITRLLSDRELEVFRLIGGGLTTREIATRLHRSVKTVESFKARIKRKLDLQNAAELARHAVLWAAEAGEPVSG